jgi:hypothetical protein
MVFKKMKGGAMISVRKRKHRRSLDAHAVESCPTTVWNGGHEYHAIMTDLSSQGAQFWVSNAHNTIQLGIGEELELKIKTPYGESHCNGIVRWTESRNENYKWGIEFTSLPEDHNDPLQALIHSGIG